MMGVRQGQSLDSECKAICSMLATLLRRNTTIAIHKRVQGVASLLARSTICS